jgi:mRNA-degrading endonuclease RelE of RelBE toxin-antitoxin system
MVLKLTKSFEEDFKGLPKLIQKACEKQLSFLLEDKEHSSLRIKKIQGRSMIWEGRVTQKYRFTFEIKDNLYVLRRVGNHDETLRNP